MPENQTDWAGLIGALIGDYLGGRGGSGDTPNFYPVPPTEDEKYWNQARRNVYEAGGTPQMKAMADAARQFYAQAPTTANVQFASPMMRGQQFAGGVQLPRIDLSRFNFGGAPPGGGGAGSDPPWAGGDSGSFPPRTPWTPERSPSETGPIEFPSGIGPLDPVTGRPLADTRPPQWGDGSDRGFYEFRQWWDDFRAEHPNWAQLGAGIVVGAATALFGPMAANWLRRAMTGERTTLPRQTNKFSDMMRNAPGVRTTLPTRTPRQTNINDDMLRNPSGVQHPWNPQSGSPQPSGAYRPIPGTGVVVGPGGRYAGGGNTEPTDTVMMPFGGGYFPGGGGPRFVLPQHPNSDPIDPMYAGNYYNLPR